MKRIFKKLWKFIKSLFSGKHDSGPDPSDTTKFKVQNCYGGFRFENAVEDPAAQIQNLTVTAKGMKYGWKAGSSLKGWGLANTDAGALAVFAVKGSDGVYRGGKFDWISKSRTTRSFENIYGGYKGWPKNAIETAKGYAFAIVADGGKKRTNWIFADKLSKGVEFRCGKPLTNKYDKE